MALADRGHRLDARLHLEVLVPRRHGGALDERVGVHVARVHGGAHAEGAHRDSRVRSRLDDLGGGAPPPASLGRRSGRDGGRARTPLRSSRPAPRPGAAGKSRRASSAVSAGGAAGGGGGAAGGLGDARAPRRPAERGRGAAGARRRARPAGARRGRGSVAGGGAPAARRGGGQRGRGGAGAGAAWATRSGSAGAPAPRKTNSRPRASRRTSTDTSAGTWRRTLTSEAPAAISSRSSFAGVAARRAGSNPSDGVHEKRRPPAKRRPSSASMIETRATRPRGGPRPGRACRTPSPGRPGASRGWSGSPIPRAPTRQRGRARPAGS